MNTTIKTKMNDLINIKVIQKDFNGEKKRFVNARELHS